MLDAGLRPSSIFPTEKILNCYLGGCYDPGGEKIDMVMTKTLLGLDLGSHSIKAVEFRQTLRGLEFVQAQFCPGNPEELPLSESVRHFMEIHGFSTDNVACAISGQRVANRRLDFPFRDSRKLAQAIPFEIEATMPFDLEDLVADWQLVTGERDHGTVAVSVAQKQDVSDFLEILRSAGCSPRILEAEGLALGNLAAIFDFPGVRLLVDIGHRKTSVCLCIEGKPVAGRTVPIGGMAITEAIARDREIDLEAAERVKCEIGFLEEAKSTDAVHALAVVDRIARELVRSLDSLDPTSGSLISHPNCQIILMGGTANLGRIDEYIESQTGVPTHLLAAPEVPSKAALLKGCDPLLFGPALALALRSSSQALTQFNFRQDEFSFRSNYAWLFGPDLRPTWGMALVCLVLAGLSGIVSIQLESRRAERLEGQLASHYAQFFPDQPIPSRPLAAFSQQVASARERASFLGLYGGNLSALDLLTLLSELIPSDLTLKFDEISIDQNVIRIKVAAQNYEAQDRLENVLKSESVFAAADVSGSAKRLKDGSVTFGLSIPLNQTEDEI
jgi:general secretion pathway protein L